MVKPEGREEGAGFPFLLAFDICCCSQSALQILAHNYLCGPLAPPFFVVWRQHIVRDKSREVGVAGFSQDAHHAELFEL